MIETKHGIVGMPGAFDSEIEALRAWKEQAQIEIARLEADLREEKSAHRKTVDQRDQAEMAIGDAYRVVTDTAPEWSNLFGHAGALDEMGDAIDRLRAERDKLRAAAKKALNYISNTESGLGITLDSGDALGAALEDAS